MGISNSKGFIYLFGVLRRFQHCTGHITTGSWKGRGNQYIEFARVVYCKLPTNGKQLPAFPHKALTGIEPWPQRWEARVLPLCHHGPPNSKGACLPNTLRGILNPFHFFNERIRMDLFKQILVRFIRLHHETISFHTIL